MLWVKLLLGLHLAFRKFRCPERKTWETGQEDGEELVGEDVGRWGAEKARGKERKVAREAR